MGIFVQYAKQIFTSIRPGIRTFLMLLSCLSQVSAVVVYLVAPSMAMTILWARQFHALNPYTIPWCYMTWTVKMLCILLQFSSFTVVWHLLDAQEQISLYPTQCSKLEECTEGWLYICVHMFSSEAPLCHKKRHQTLLWLSVVWMERIWFYSLETESSEL